MPCEQAKKRTETLCRRTQGYLALTDQMVLTLSDLFESIAEDPTAWATMCESFCRSGCHKSRWLLTASV